MGLLDRFRKKKKVDVVVEAKKTITELEQLCGDDKETYEALHHTMFLDPRKVGTSMKEAATNAKEYEKGEDFIKARLWYEIAGGLAIYEGNVIKVIEYFGELQKILREKLSQSGEYPILKIPEKAVAKAQEFYAMHLK